MKPEKGAEVEYVEAQEHDIRNIRYCDLGFLLAGTSRLGRANKSKCAKAAEYTRTGRE